MAITTNRETLTSKYLVRSGGKGEGKEMGMLWSKGEAKRQEQLPFPWSCASFSLVLRLTCTKEKKMISTYTKWFK